jgi:ABC-type transport system substrate-binding protein
LRLPLLLILTLAVTASPEPSLPVANAVTQTGPTLWQPFGPYANKVQITVYGDFAVMFQNFVDGKIDITDWPVPKADEQGFGANPDFFLTEGLDEFGIFQVDISHHNNFLGIPMQENRASDSFNSLSTKQPSVAGIEVRKTIAHLIDKPDLMNANAVGLKGHAKYVDIQAPPLHGLIIGGSPPSQLPPSVRAEDCAAHPWFTPCDASNPPVSAYNLVADSISGASLTWGHGFIDRGYPGAADLRAACDHLTSAGFSISPAGSDCLAVAQGTAHLVAAGQASFFIRSHQPRKVFGNIIRDALNFLFGTPGADNPNCIILHGTTCFERYFTLTEVTDIIFKTDPEKDDWHLYTGGWFLGSFPDHLLQLYHSSFASNACGGKRSTFAQNYHFFCSPAFDEEASAGEFAPTFADANAHFLNAALIAHREVMTVPIYSGAGQRFLVLNGWDGLVSELGKGFQRGFWPLLNMRCRPGYVPSNPTYAPGGGDCTVIRRGFSQEVHRLSPFHANTLWEFEVLTSIYDSMLMVNPLTAGVGRQVIDWMTVKHTSSFDPNEVFAGVTGTTTQTWVLRNDLRWHDEVPVTADDVAYSIDVLARLCFTVLPCPSPPGAKALDSRTVEVKLSGPSPFHELNIGTLSIIPKHIWEPLGDAVITDPGFDPMAAGIMVGSGPFMCLNVDNGAIGGSCTRTASGTIGTQQVSLNGQIILTAYDGYHHGRPGVSDSPLHKFSWADRNNDGSISIIDVADIALRFGGPDAYWNTGQNPMAPQTIGSDPTKVDIVEVALVASYFGQKLTQPFPASQIIGIDPDIDPFF